MLRELVIKEIETILGGNSFFSIHDFSITSSENRYDDDLRITYRDKEKYYFHVAIPRSITKKENESYYEISGEACPWSLAAKEKVIFHSKAKLLDGIQLWVSFLVEDLKSFAANRKISEIEQRLKNAFEKIEDIEGDYFSGDEILDIINKLSSLEEEFKSKIKDVYDSKAEADQKLSKLHEEIQALKDKLEILDKAQWKKSFLSKTFDWLKDPKNQKMLSTGARIVKDLLPENTFPSD